MKSTTHHSAPGMLYIVCDYVHCIVASVFIIVFFIVFVNDCIFYFYCLFTFLSKLLMYKKNTL